MLGSFFKRKHFYQAIEPDEILIDAANLPAFDRTRLEGTIERPFSSGLFRNFLLLSLALVLVCVGQLAYLQIVKHNEFETRAEANRLSHLIILAERGLITDRRGVPLAENLFINDSTIAVRRYPLRAAAAALTGYVTYPKQDKNGFWYQDTIEGVAGIEAMLNSVLQGEKGLQIRETDATGNTVSGSVIRDAISGVDVHLSVDSGLQEEMYRVIAHRSEESKWQGGAGTVMDIETGELLALVSYPSYDPEVMSEGKPEEEVVRLLSDPRSPFLDRSVAGLYTPGSVVKPFVAVAALEEHIITPDTQILSTGSISIPNPYNPKKPSVFKDWKAHGLVDMRHALAVSSDVYFYEVGGGFENQAGLGIANIEKYMRLFGFGESTGSQIIGEEAGIIPNPEWKARQFDGEPWYLGDTYHTAIGQYGFQVTLMELVRGAAAVANGGTLVTPVITAGRKGTQTYIPVSNDNLQIVREGMRLAVTEGIAQALSIPGIQVAAKTGTAEVGVRKESVNSLVIGFFPYDTPRYAFAVVMEKAPAGTPHGAPAVMGEVLRWLVAKRPQMVAD